MSVSVWAEHKASIEEAMHVMCDNVVGDKEEAGDRIMEAVIELTARCEAMDAHDHYRADVVGVWDRFLAAQGIIEDQARAIERLRKVQRWAAVKFEELGVRFDPLWIMVGLDGHDDH
jgi:hypothetical protein